MLGLAAASLGAGCNRSGAVAGLSYTLLDGSRGSFAALRGQVVLVNFWATQCGPCVAGMPGLVAVHEALRASGLQTLAIAMSYDPPAAVAQFAESRKLPFGVVIDNTGTLARGFGDVTATPTTVVLDRQGQVALRSVGKLDDDTLRATLAQLLALPTGAST